MQQRKKKITILGSTGSIGTQTIDVVKCLSGRFDIVSLAAFGDADIPRLAEQVEMLSPYRVALFDERAADKFAAESAIPVLAGMDGILELISDSSVDIVVNAIGGAAGLLPSLTALENGKRLALANKESLVAAGHLINDALKKGGELIPIDSEHSALFQSMLAGKRSEVRRLILTASGGPFWGKDVDADAITPREALAHPNWSMGARITIDSATMFNKGMEVIEAHWLFGISSDRIDVVIHPQSIVHSIVEFADGSQIAQMSLPDMRLPIQYALTYPERLPSPLAPLNLWESGSLEFYSVPKDRFPAYWHLRRALELGGTAPAALNAVDEVAVAAFLNGRIRFGDIARLIGLALAEFDFSDNPSLDDILAADKMAREWGNSKI